VRWLGLLLLLACASDPAQAALERVKRGQLREAEALYRKDLDGDEARAGLVAVLIMNGRVDAARAESLDCRSQACLFVAAFADVEQSDALAARLAPRLANVVKARALLEHAPEVTPELAAQAERLIGDDASFRVAPSLPFLDSYASRLKAQVRTLAGDPRAAIAVLAPVAARRPDDVPVLLQLAMAYAAVDDRATALATVERVFVVWPQADPDAAYVRKARQLRAAWSTL
jgi:hypothetical protein